MDETTFRAELARRGCSEPYPVTWDAGRVNAEHAHAGTVRGLVPRGGFTIRQAGACVDFGPGDVFEVPDGRLHHETTGAQGVHFIVGYVDRAA